MPPGDATRRCLSRAGLEGPSTLKRPDRAQVRLHAVTIAFSGVVAIVETPQHVMPNASQIGGSVVRCGGARFHAWCPYAKPSAVLIPPRLTSHSPDTTRAACVARQQPSEPETARQLANPGVLLSRASASCSHDGAAVVHEQVVDRVLC